MLTFSGGLKIFLAVAPLRPAQELQWLACAGNRATGRRSARWSAVRIHQPPHSRLKILLFDGTGLWVCTKRLEQGTFSWPKAVEPGRTKLSLSPQALAMLTDGVDLRGGKLRPWYEREEA